MPDYALYIDDSGHPDNTRYVVVAGFVSTVEDWLQFEPKWNDALIRNCLGRVFHMTDFMAESRTVKERSRILQELASIINSHTRASFVGAVDVAAYRRVNEEYALEECLGAPYALAARALAIEMNEWMKPNMSTEDKLLLLAEDGTKHRGDMEQVFLRDKLPAPQRVPKSMAAVQPADMLAWETYNSLSRGRQLRRVRRLLGDHTQFGKIFREGDLRATCLTPGANVLLRSTVPPEALIAFHSTPKRKRKRTIK